METRLTALMLVTLFALQKCVEAHDCSSGEMRACKPEIEALKTERTMQDLTNDLYALDDICRKQFLAIECVNSYAEECLPEYEQAQFKKLIEGWDEFFTRICVEDSALRKSFMEHSSCIKTVSEELDRCTESYETAQRKLEDFHGSPKILMERTCCTYLDNIECSANVTQVMCGDKAAVVVTELWSLLGGSYLNRLCQPLAAGHQCVGVLAAAASTPPKLHASSVFSVALATAWRFVAVR